jgi:predicted peptidase
MTTCQVLDSHTQYHRRFGWLEAALLLATVTLIAQLVPDAAPIWREWPWPGCQTPGHVELADAARHRWIVQYLVYTPNDRPAEPRQPLLLFLHGIGERGDDLDQLLKWGLPHLVANGMQLPMMVVSPQCRPNATWNARELLVFLDYLVKRFNVDPDRIYVSGESMGGYGTWDLVGVAPERFAAAVPVCGGGDVGQAERLTKTPIWAFHGTEDNVVPIERSRRMVDAVEALDGNAQLTVLAGQGHGIGEMVFSRDDLYAWLLEHRRQH